MTLVTIRESPQSHYPRLTPTLRPIAFSRGQSRQSRLSRSRNRGTREVNPKGLLSPATYHLQPTTCYLSCNLLLATYNLLPFVTTADYHTTIRFRYPLYFQSLHLDRGVGSITAVVRPDFQTSAESIGPTCGLRWSRSDSGDRRLPKPEA